MKALILLLAIALSSGCVSLNDRKGVDNLWRAADFADFEDGSSTQADVARVLGPPSQVISLGSRTVFYYLLEALTGRGFYLLFYNRMDKTVRYDRAVFFFDEEGVLESHAYSRESLEPDQ